MRRHTAVFVRWSLTPLAALLLSVGADAAQAQARPKPVAPPVQGTVVSPDQAPAGAPQATLPPAGAAASQVPSAATLGVPFFEGMQFIESYDAGAGQRFFLFGTAAGFEEVVAFYRTALKQRGELVFEKPATHEFDIGKFREETMAFPPSITVKDYFSATSQGYPNPKPGAEPANFRTVIQIVPIPSDAPTAVRR
jgi:hypothetical protein